jgi:hypothetical protein
MVEANHYTRTGESAHPKKPDIRYSALDTLEACHFFHAHLRTNTAIITENHLEYKDTKRLISPLGTADIIGTTERKCARAFTIWMELRGLKRLHKIEGVERKVSTLTRRYTNGIGAGKIVSELHRTVGEFQ